MATSTDVSKLPEEVRRRLLRSFQSGRVSFLIGSGASQPAIPTAGPIEAEITKLLSEANNVAATDRLYGFLGSVWDPTNKVIANELDGPVGATLTEYVSLLRVIEKILMARRTTLLPRQVNVFSTNYDLFVEKASEQCPTLSLNDGFLRAPGLGARLEFSTRNFFRASYSTGNLYDYKVEMPSVNLVKLHGSCSWKRTPDTIEFCVDQHPLLDLDASAVEKRTFVDKCAVVLPQMAKFRETTMDRTYYDLLRMFANSLDLENSALIVFGFSFADDHIRDITSRALKNPTLRIMLFAYDDAARLAYSNLFGQYGNVEIIFDSTGAISFGKLNQILAAVLDAKESAA